MIDLVKKNVYFVMVMIAAMSLTACITWDWTKFESPKVPSEYAVILYDVAVLYLNDHRDDFTDVEWEAIKDVGQEVQTQIDLGEVDVAYIVMLTGINLYKEKNNLSENDIRYIYYGLTLLESIALANDNQVLVDLVRRGKVFFMPTPVLNAQVTSTFVE